MITTTFSYQILNQFLQINSLQNINLPTSFSYFTIKLSKFPVTKVEISSTKKTREIFMHVRSFDM